VERVQNNMKHLERQLELFFISILLFFLALKVRRVGQFKQYLEFRGRSGAKKIKTTRTSIGIKSFWQLSDSIWAIKCGEHRVGKETCAITSYKD